MKKTMFTALVIGSTLRLEAQESANQAPPPQQPQQANPQQNPNVPQGRMPPGRTVIPTNPPQNRFGAAISNRFAATNLTPTGATATNRFAATNTGGMGANQNVSVTNTLSTMAPAQAQNVIQVQNGLSGLQNLAVNIGGIQNVQQIIQQNPQIQQQLQQVQAQISSLAQGQTKPSDESVQRLCQD